MHNTPAKRQGEWSGDARVAWSVIKDIQIETVQRDTTAVAWEWLNCEFQTRSKNVINASRREGKKGASGDIITILTHSKIPLKELSETGYREKPSQLDLTKGWGGKENPEPRQMIMALAFLIYEMNKCAISMTTQNVKECAKNEGCL